MPKIFVTQINVLYHLERYIKGSTEFIIKDMNLFLVKVDFENSNGKYSIFLKSQRRNDVTENVRIGQLNNWSLH